MPIGKPVDLSVVCESILGAACRWSRWTPPCIQHSFWLFDTEENARAAEATFNQLRGMADAPATFLGVDVCEIVGHA
jgi:hypothetical protein